MGTRMRRPLPDNLDPLVDTLANVVGILVIVIVLTQIQVGGALDRLAAFAEERLSAEVAQAQRGPSARQDLAMRRASIESRAEVDLASAPSKAKEVLESLAALPPAFDAVAAAEHQARKSEIETLRKTLSQVEEASAHRSRYAAALERVPPHRVARLPEPQVVRGLESWILVRYGRVYLVDREALFEDGSDAIQRILPDGGNRLVRPDEFESAAHYLRKRPIGKGPLRWQLESEPSVRVLLSWDNQEGGLERTRIPQATEWQAWLAARSPDQDFIRFHVWSDSFETYLAARQAVEEAGFRAGWEGYPEDTELDMGLRFGPRDPRKRSIEVD